MSEVEVNVVENSPTESGAQLNFTHFRETFFEGHPGGKPLAVMTSLEKMTDQERDFYAKAASEKFGIVGPNNEELSTDEIIDELFYGPLYQNRVTLPIFEYNPESGEVIGAAQFTLTPTLASMGKQSRDSLGFFSVVGTVDKSIKFAVMYGPGTIATKLRNGGFGIETQEELGNPKHRVPSIRSLTRSLVENPVLRTSFTLGEEDALHAEILEIAKTSGYVNAPELFPDAFVPNKQATVIEDYGQISIDNNFPSPEGDHVIENKHIFPILETDDLEQIKQLGYDEMLAYLGDREPLHVQTERINFLVRRDQAKQEA